MKPMSAPGSVTNWIGELKAGNHAVAQHLWERYFQRLVGLARKKLEGLRKRAADEEDVALSAFDSFCRGAERGRFPQLTDRDDLWRLLVVITARKACDLIQQEARQKRGGGKVRGESVWASSPDSEEAVFGLEQVLGREPTPEYAAQVAEEFQRLLARLDDPELRSIALWKMEGFTNNEIAAKLKWAGSTVERKLRLIRGVWEKES
jgi:DNA-directed RNA polymerase specialized sigma24 family protein